MPSSPVAQSQEHRASGLADAVDSLWKFQLRREHTALLEQTRGFSAFIAEARESNHKIQQRLDGLQSIIEKLASDFKEVVDAVTKKRNELEGNINENEVGVVGDSSTTAVMAMRERIESTPAPRPQRKTRKTTKSQNGVRRATRASTRTPHPSSEASIVSTSAMAPAARDVKKPKEMPPVRKKRMLISDEDIAAGIMM